MPTEIAIVSLTLICVALLISQYNLIRNLRKRNEFLRNLETEYNKSMLARVKLEERCDFLESFEKKYVDIQEKYAELEKQNALLEEKIKYKEQNLAEQMKLLTEAEKKLSDTFKALSSDALSKNNQSFLDLAQNVFSQLHEKAKSEFATNTKSFGDLVIPIKQALEGVGVKLNDLEKSRVGAYEALRQQVGDLILSQNSLKNETNHLVSALRTPATRGCWGEMQLRRVVELSGMVEHCDFKEQVSAEDQDTKIRPDMVIYYPGGKQIVVDAKVPLTAYLRSLETDDDVTKKSLLKEHAKQIREHVVKLSKKKYWEQFDSSPEFVIMFLPGDVFFSVAMEQDPSLMEFAMRERVMISTPTTLWVLLHTIAWGWRQENLAENAKQIVKLGQELYKRLSDLSQRFASLGRSISGTVSNYNQVVANLESRVLVSARKFKEMETHEKSIAELRSIENTVQHLKEE